jgi:protein associated with RNAse G/E
VATGNLKRKYMSKRCNFLSNRSEKVEKAEEDGFTGKPSEWFSDEEFNKNILASIDHDQKKDYYFNSYSSFYIHEQMIKDRVICLSNF